MTNLYLDFGQVYIKCAICYSSLNEIKDSYLKEIFKIKEQRMNSFLTDKIKDKEIPYTYRNINTYTSNLELNNESSYNDNINKVRSEVLTHKDLNRKSNVITSNFDINADNKEENKENKDTISNTKNSNNINSNDDHIKALTAKNFKNHRNSQRGSCKCDIETTDFDFNNYYADDKTSTENDKSMINLNNSNSKAHNFPYIDIKLSLIVRKKYILLFSFQKNKLSEFMNSSDYIIIKKETEKITELEYSGINDIFTSSILSKLFSHVSAVKKLTKSIHLAIIAIDMLNSLPQHRKSFYTLPDIKLIELNTVGKIIKLSGNDKTYLENDQKELYPYVLANIIEGNSIYLVEGKNKFKRLGGSSFGATTYWSLIQLLCGYDDPYTAVMEGLEGDNEKIDLSVGDIYGGAYEHNSLPEKLIASSFGKIKKMNDITTIDRKDISRSLMALFCLCNGQIMSLHTKNSNLNKCLLIGNPFEVLEFQQLIQMTVHYNSKNTVGAFFGDYNSFLSILGMITITELNDE